MARGVTHSISYLNSGNNHSHLIAGKSVFFQPSFFFLFLFFLFGNNPSRSSGFCSFHSRHILIFLSIYHFFQIILWKCVFYVLQLPSSLTLSLPYSYFCLPWHYQHYKKLVSFTTSVYSDVEESFFKNLQATVWDVDFYCKGTFLKKNSAFPLPFNEEGMPRFLHNVLKHLTSRMRQISNL